MVMNVKVTHFSNCYQLHWYVKLTLTIKKQYKTYFHVKDQIIACVVFTICIFSNNLRNAVGLSVNAPQIYDDISSEDTERWGDCSFPTGWCHVSSLRSHNAFLSLHGSKERRTQNGFHHSDSPSLHWEKGAYGCLLVLMLSFTHTLCAHTPSVTNMLN